MLQLNALEIALSLFDGLTPAQIGNHPIFADYTEDERKDLITRLDKCKALPLINRVGYIGGRSAKRISKEVTERYNAYCNGERTLLELSNSTIKECKRIFENCLDIAELELGMLENDKSSSKESDTSLVMDRIKRYKKALSEFNLIT